MIGSDKMRDRFAGFMENDFADGLGISVSFWTQGCPHRCEGCHNPQTWDFNGGKVLPPNYIENIIQSLHKNNLTRNLAVLGGEPLCKENAEIVYNLIKAVKENDNNVKIFVWTGYNFEDIINSCNTYAINSLKYIDILIDGKFDLSKSDISLLLKGSSNQRVIDVQKTLKNEKVEIFKYQGKFL